MTRPRIVSTEKRKAQPVERTRPAPLLLGAHMSIAGGHDKAVRAAAGLGLETLQVFTKSSNQWSARPLTGPGIEAFQSALGESGISRVVAHNSYLINLASPDADLWERSIAAMVVELERAEALGIGDLVSHPGAHVGSGEKTGSRRIARAIDVIHRRAPGLRVRIDLETTAGQGTCLGHRFEHLAAILDRVREPERLGICLDSCHLFAAGYSLASEEAYNETFEAFDRTVGVGRVRAWHLNDSLRELGSRVDRHAGIGRGQMGLEPFWRVLHDERFLGVPFILETPKGTEDGVDLDRINIGLLRQLWESAELPRGAAWDGGCHV